MSNALRKVIDGHVKVSYIIDKVSEGLGKESDVLCKGSDGLGKVSVGLRRRQMVSGSIKWSQEGVRGSWEGVRWS